MEHTALKGSSHDDLSRRLSERLFRWQLLRDILVRVHRVSTKDNPADEPSRTAIRDAQRQPVLERGDHMLRPSLFRTLQALAPSTFTIDACASPGNAQLRRFIARDWWPDPGCVAANVLSFSFPPRVDGPEYVYCNPPWAIIAPVWSHFRQCRLAGAMVFPWMPTQPWCGMILREATAVGRLARQGDADVFRQPSRGYRSSVGPVRWDVMYAPFDFTTPA